MVDVPDFDALYRDDPDPWRVASSFYERRKLDVVLASLTRESYRTAWDPACGTGELAARLVRRVDTVVATDAAAEAVRLTAARCAELPEVTVGRITQPGLPERPSDGFDLIVAAEFAYYLPAEDRVSMWGVVDAAAGRAAELVVVHWRHRPHDAYLSGLDANLEAVERLTTTSDWYAAVRHDDQDFVLDVLLRGAR
ncbi:MAG TPA: class I SAM-dependent methyltransferase [Microlunatus sp.]|nr:class I SAM-dependent methyltransferase [Microlunatus sp.]